MNSTSAAAPILVVVTRDATRAAPEVAAHRSEATDLSCPAPFPLMAFTGVDTLGTPDQEITHLVDVTGWLELRWRAGCTHASRFPPFDADLQYGSLAVDRLQQTGPPRKGGTRRTAWIPSTRNSTTEREVLR